jgi:hypothetical protein
MISDSDLSKKKYSLEELSKNIERLSISRLLNTQKLDADFCNKYILNEEYQSVEDRYKITFEYVLKKQPHINYKDLGK